MQLSELRRAVRDHYGIASNEGQAQNDVLNRLINASIREFTLERDWDWNTKIETVATVVDQEEYSRAADARKTMRIVDTEFGRILQHVSANYGARYRNFSSIPVFWWIEGGVLHFAPTPSDVRNYEHVYQKTETALSGDTDEPTIPDWAIDQVIALACLKLARRLGDANKQVEFAQEVEYTRQALADDVSGAQPNPRRATRRDWTRQGGF